MSHGPEPGRPPDSGVARAVRSPAAAGLVTLMALGSVLMWLGTPLIWLWLVSQLVSSSQPSLGPYLLVLVGIVSTMVALGKGLGVLNRKHVRITGIGQESRRPQRTWNRSMRDGRTATRERGVLEPVMMGSVAIALALFTVWFFAFAGSSIG